MYLDFFKFRKNPFHIAPDPEFLFLSPSHKEAFGLIFHGIEDRKGLVTVTGEVGVGKTTILRSYLEETDPERIRVVYIFNPGLSFEKLLKQIVSDLGIPAVDKDPPELVESLYRYLIDEYKNDRNVVLIIDEAQNMPVETLDRLRMLSDLETSQEKLLQIILVGQPEFENKLNLPELKQLRQQIAIRCRIDTLRPDESLAYIRHRLMKASLFHNPVFTKGALKRIVKEADGIARIINVLCDNALITAFAYQRNPVDDKIIKEVIEGFRGGQPGVSFGRKPVLARALVVFSALVVLCSMALLMPEEIPPLGKEILSANVPELQPAVEMVKEPEAGPPVPSAPEAEPEPSIPDPPATGGDRSVSEIVPPASVQWETPGETETQAPAAQKAPVPDDGGATAQEGIAAGTETQSYLYIVHVGSFADREKAEKIKTRLSGKGYDAVIKTLKQPARGHVFVIELQPVNSISTATTLMTQLSGEIQGEPVIVKVPSQ